MLVVAGVTYWLNISRLDRALALARAEDLQLQQLLTEGEPLTKSSALVQTWIDAQIHSLDELQALAAQLPGTDRVYLTGLRIDPASSEGRGRIKLEGFARQQADVMSLNTQLLAAQDRYHVQPHTTQPATADTFYPWKFEAETILKPPSKKRAAATAAPAASTTAATPAAPKSPPAAG